MSVKVIEPYDPIKASAMKPGEIRVRVDEEADNLQVHANGIVVDVVSNDDGSVYVEFYAYETGKQAMVSAAFIDAYQFPHPSVRLTLANRPKPKEVTHDR